MAKPVLGSFANQVYNGLNDVAQPDASLGWPLANYIQGLGMMFQIVEDYSRDQFVNGKLAPGWSQLLDINRAPNAALGWLGQFVGVPLQQGLTDAQQRARILSVGGWNRGTIGSMVAAAQQYLTGTQTVVVRERDASVTPADPAYGLTVITRTSETPDSAKVLAALLTQKPAGIILNYQTLTGTDYQGLFTTYADYQAIFTTYTTYEGVLDLNPGH